MKYTTY